ncbi:uncharacterized protein LOC130672410 [Microplitis mediator]|uniref:uncharacterized protein LOC130672410 n=1 Tax=Microplitis mediator TaxID=375433 RepID=UPI00255730CE|nr:uncharacterized protein LOC130672410 [Microplitis mediator]
MACYAAVINYFKQSTPNLQVLSVTTDFEIGLRNVFRRYYPTAMIKGCYFHYIQALIKKAEKLGLLNILKNWDDGKDFFKKIVALALLPANEIENAFNWLIATHNPLIPTFKKFLEYYESYWINCVKPIHFSVFGFINKTNNFMEAYNRCLKLQFGIHPRIWQFTEHLVRQYEKMKTELNSLMMSRPVRQIQRIEYFIRKEVLNRVWELYRNNVFDFKRFLQCAHQMIKIFVDDKVISQTDEVDNHLNAVIKKHIAINDSLYVTINEDDDENFIFVLDK